MHMVWYFKLKTFLIIFHLSLICFYRLHCLKYSIIKDVFEILNVDNITLIKKNLVLLTIRTQQNVIEEPLFTANVNSIFRIFECSNIQTSKFHYSSINSLETSVFRPRFLSSFFLLHLKLSRSSFRFSDDPICFCLFYILSYARVPCSLPTSLTF